MLRLGRGKNGSRQGVAKRYKRDRGQCQYQGEYEQKMRRPMTVTGENRHHANERDPGERPPAGAIKKLQIVGPYMQKMIKRQEKFGDGRYCKKHCSKKPCLMGSNAERRSARRGPASDELRISGCDKKNAKNVGWKNRRDMIMQKPIQGIARDFRSAASGKDHRTEKRGH